jgi:hypothetical protein
VNPDRAKYRDSYRIAAAFLDWGCRTHDKNLVKKLDASLRDNTYTSDIWVKLTKKSLDDLWTEYTDSLRVKK